MERLEDKKRRLAKKYGIKRLAKGRKIEPIQLEDGSYKINRQVASAPFVGNIALGKILRLSGLEDIVPLRWDEKCGCYHVIEDENATDGVIFEFTLLYGEDKA